MSSIPQPPRSPLDPQRPESIAIWRRWFEDITKIISTLSGVAGISWDALSKAGSNLADLVIRNHNDLENIQGGSVGQRYHLTSEAATTAENAESLFLQLDQTEPQNVVNGSPVFDALDFNLTPDSPSGVTGRLRWNSAEGTLDLGQPNDVTQQIGQETFIYIKNQTGAQLSNGKAIMFAGAVGASGRLKGQYAIADGTIPAQYIMGIATQDIADAADGFVTTFGKVRGIDTSGTPYGEVWADGDILYVSPTTLGGLTKTAPNAPNLQILVAAVVNAHAVQGTLFVRPTFVTKLTDLDDVNGTPLTVTGQFPVWNNTAGYFDFDFNINNYFYKPGLAGGQTAYGGAAAGENLTIGSTAHATKGKVLLGNSAYDEVNNRLGIGTQSPAAPLDISPPSGTAATILMKSTGAAQSKFILDRASTSVEGCIDFRTAGVLLYCFGFNDDGTNNLYLTDDATTTYWTIIGKLFGIGVSPTAMMHVKSTLATDITCKIQGATSQSANLHEWLNASSFQLAYIDKDGRLAIQTQAPVAALKATSDFVHIADNTQVGSTIVAAISNSTSRPYYRGIKARGTLASPSAVVTDDLLFSFLAAGYDGSAASAGAAISFYCDGTPTSGVSTPERISFNTGGSTALQKERLQIKNDGQIKINPNSDANVVLLQVKAHATQTANLTEWQNSSAAVLSSVSATGVFTAPNYISTVATGTQPYACTSTTVNTNLNADMLDGKHTGTSGNTVPLLDGNNTWSGVNKYSDNIVLPKTSGKGIQVDTASPTFGFRDLLGEIKILSPGANDPTLSVFRDSVRAFSFSNAVMNEVNFHFHIPHDYVPGSDIFIHAHWSQNVVDTGGPAGAPGDVKWSFEVTYAKGHNQAAWPATFTTSVTQTASGTQYQHMLAEVQLSAASPSATQIDSDILEPDGVIIVRAFRDPTDVADTLNQVPFMHYTDIHYQSTNMATKAKTPDFYA